MDYFQKEIKPREAILLSIAFVVLVVFIDYALKANLELLGIESWCNTGIGLGLPIEETMFYPLIAIIGGYLLFYCVKTCKKHDYLRSFASLIMIAGGCANLIDRIKNGCVTDFININPLPVFNFADLTITIGAAILIYSLFFRSTKK